jgi:transposase
MIESYEAESIGAIPMIFGLLDHVELSKEINSHYPSHKNRQGGDKGIIVSVWLCYILTLKDHRLYTVESWFNEYSRSLNLLLQGYGYGDLSGKDFTDDRLGSLLSSFGQEAIWQIFMNSFSRKLLKMYEIQVQHVELDATIAQQYREIIEGGLLQMGHSKQHRRDLGQIKSMLSNAAEQNIPLMINTVSGNRADDGLYVPLIEQTRHIIGTEGILWQGDSKLGSLDNRYEIAKHNDFYLTPASLVQIKTEVLRDYVSKHKTNNGLWENIYLDKPVKKDLSKPFIKEDADKTEKVLIGVGFEVQVVLSHKGLAWTERRLIVRSESYSSAQIALFTKHLDQAVTQLNALKESKKGKAIPKSADELLKKAETIVQKNNLASFFTFEVFTKNTIKEIKGYKGAPDRTEETKTFDLQIEQNETLIEQNKEYLGYRVYLTNQNKQQLPIQKAVENYRKEYQIERRIRNLKQEVCALLPIYLQKDDRIVGLVNLLTLLLQIVSIAEYRIAQSLKEEVQKDNQKLEGLYPGQPKLKTNKPSIRKLIEALSPIMFIAILNDNLVVKKIITNQNQLTQKIIDLLRLPRNPYDVLLC